jgi:DNA primase
MSGSEFKDRVRGEVPIDSYITRFVPLKKAGRSLTGLCPFHNEKTPSFHVNPKGGYYHCFGCKASGDIFKFVMDYHRVDFPRAMEILSEFSGIPLHLGKSPMDSEKAKKKDEAYRLNQKTTEYFKNCLKDSRGLEARNYLEKRGITLDEAETFDIGFSPEGFQNLKTDVLRSLYEEELGIELGVLKKNDKGNVYDFYRNRIMFPIKDGSGRIVGFSGRTLSTDGIEAKYINSPNSIIYDKGRQIYNLFLAQEEIRNSRKVFVVEGVLDAIGLYTRGIKNVVAPLGTSFTENQARLLKNLADIVVIVMDGDSAGTKGAIRASEILIKEGCATSVVLMETGEDPFDFSRKVNRSELRTKLDSGLSAWQFLIEDAIQGKNTASSPEEKKSAIESLFTFVKKWEKQTDRQLFISEASKRLGLSISALWKDFTSNIEQFAPSVSDNTNNAVRKVAVKRPMIKGAAECERSLLAKLISHPELFRYADEIDALEFLEDSSVLVWEWLFTQFHMGETVNPAEFLSTISIPEEIRENYAPFLLQEEMGVSEDQNETIENFKVLLVYQQIYYHRSEKDRYMLDISASKDEFDRISWIKLHKDKETQLSTLLRNNVKVTR